MMAGESQQLPSGAPDPSVLTTEQLMRMVGSERDYVDGQIQVLVTRLDAMDKATEVLHETVTRVPTDIQLAVEHLQSVLDERFNSIVIQFAERDTRSERESRDNKVAVDAAFAAQKEAAAKQDEGNQKAIDKSEKTTGETIGGLSSKIDDLKDRVGTIESRKEGATETRSASATSANLLIAVLGVILTVLILGVAIYAATH